MYILYFSFTTCISPLCCNCRHFWRWRPESEWYHRLPSAWLTAFFRISNWNSFKFAPSGQWSDADWGRIWPEQGWPSEREWKVAISIITSRSVSCKKCISVGSLLWQNSASHDCALIRIQDAARESWLAFSLITSWSIIPECAAWAEQEKNSFFLCQAKLDPEPDLTSAPVTVGQKVLMLKQVKVILRAQSGLKITIAWSVIKTFRKKSYLVKIFSR